MIGLGVAGPQLEKGLGRGWILELDVGAAEPATVSRDFAANTRRSTGRR